MPFAICPFCRGVIYIRYYTDDAVKMLDIKCPQRSCKKKLQVNVGMDSYKVMLPLLWDGQATWEKRNVDKREKDLTHQELYEEEISKFAPDTTIYYDGGLQVTDKRYCGMTHLKDSRHNYHKKAKSNGT